MFRVGTRAMFFLVKTQLIWLCIGETIKANLVSFTRSAGIATEVGPGQPQIALPRIIFTQFAQKRSWHGKKQASANPFRHKSPEFHETTSYREIIIGPMSARCFSRKEQNRYV